MQSVTCNRTILINNNPTALFSRSCIAIACIALTSCVTYQARIHHSGFVSVNNIIPDVRYEIRYAGSNNFMGRPVNGYKGPGAYLTTQAASALSTVQAELHTMGLGLKIFDAYRPQRAVDNFMQWARDLADTANKRAYYPDVPKTELFNLGYIAAHSGHTRGSTVDLTVIDLASGNELDMGGTYDFFGNISHYDATVSDVQRQHRDLLHDVMIKHGFNPYPEEWWHFTLKDEPYPDRYFNFPVKAG